MIQDGTDIAERIGSSRGLSPTSFPIAGWSELRRKSLTSRTKRIELVPTILVLFLGLSRLVSPRSREACRCDLHFFDLDALWPWRWLCCWRWRAVSHSGVFAGEPDPKSYWDVAQIRPGMKGIGRTVMVGTKLEEFGAEVLGVMRDVSPGRDMVLCRLTGCNLEHAGIIQGMSGSPIYIDGKLLGAVAFAWEFAKDPIAGVTPFSQMCQYVRSNDRRIAAESKATFGREVPCGEFLRPALD